MAKITWTVINETQFSLDITQYVRSINFTLGRPSALSTYAGNTATITISNNSNQVTFAKVNDEITLKVTLGIFDYFVFIGTIISRNFQDEPGNGYNSTATLLLNDSLMQFGMANLVSQSLASTSDQITEINDLLLIGLQSPYGTDVATSVGTFSVNAGQRLNEIIFGDRGIITNNNSFKEYVPPSEFAIFFNPDTPTFGRTTSATQIAYQNFDRVEAPSSSLFFTQATVTGSASTETKNSSALTNYGTRTFTATTAQSDKVSATAEWYANAFSDPNNEILNLTFTDIAQNENALLYLVTNILLITYFAQVSYTPPGGVSKTGYYWPEQITVNATIDQTSINLLMTPITYYANFILNDAVLGVLDTDRLGV